MELVDLLRGFLVHTVKNDVLALLQGLAVALSQFRRLREPTIN